MPMAALAFLAAPAAPILLALVRNTFLYGPQSVWYVDLKTFFPLYCTTAGITFVVGGLPYLVLRRFNLIRWWTMLAWGVSGGLFVAGLLAFLTGMSFHGDRIDIVRNLSFLALIVGWGGLEGLGFWAAWTVVRVNRKSPVHTGTLLVLTAAVLMVASYWYINSLCQDDFGDRYSEEDLTPECRLASAEKHRRFLGERRTYILTTPHSML